MHIYISYNRVYIGHMKLIAATKNKGKIDEIRSILSEAPYGTRIGKPGAAGLQVVSAKDACNGNYAGVVECGSTYAENALIKAWSIFRGIGAAESAAVESTAVESTAAAGDISTAMVIADDSGLEVDYLKGWPGIFSSRFGGGNASDDEKVRKLLNLLKNLPAERRKARFVCAVAAYLPGGYYITAQATWNGLIAFEPKGDNGFGYDPVFVDPEYGMTAAQLPPELKNSISHRGKALRLILHKIPDIYLK